MEFDESALVATIYGHGKEGERASDSVPDGLSTVKDGAAGPRESFTDFVIIIIGETRGACVTAGIWSR